VESWSGKPVDCGTLCCRCFRGYFAAKAGSFVELKPAAERAADQRKRGFSKPGNVLEKIALDSNAAAGLSTEWANHSELSEVRGLTNKQRETWQVGAERIRSLCRPPLHEQYRP
jgi:hypothetical protein